MLSVKGFSFTIIVSILCILLSAVAVVASTPSAANTGTPFVLNANEVPVAGGVLYIYGLNLGSDENLIEVKIVDIINGDICKCVNVTIVLSNSIISCSIVDIGTGRAKHIAVTVNGVTNDYKTDSNAVFSRHAPKLNALTYRLEKAIVLIEGKNFGNNAGVVSVLLDGREYPIISVNDSFIVCSRLSTYDPPTSRVAYVTVDGQTSMQNMTVAVDYSVSEKLEIDHIDLSSGDNSDENSFIPKDKIKFAWIGLGVLSGLAVVSLLVGLLALKRRKMLHELQLKSANSAVAVVTEQVDPLAGKPLPPLTRDQSMVEIDLRHDSPSSPPCIYERHNESMTSSSASSSPSLSSLSPHSSTCSTPADSPLPSPVVSPHTLARASHANDSEASPSQRAVDSPTPIVSTRRPMPPPLDLDGNAHRSSFSMTPPISSLSSAKMRGMMRVPSSRIAHRALDSPYFAKQGAFDSPKQGAFDSPNL